MEMLSGRICFKANAAQIRARNARAVPGNEKG
jgi:hypothetical protein